MVPAAIPCHLFDSGKSPPVQTARRDIRPCRASNSESACLSSAPPQQTRAPARLVGKALESTDPDEGVVSRNIQVQPEKSC